VIIDAKQPAGVQPYVAWARDQDGVGRNAHDRHDHEGWGQITVVGVQDTANFTAAIKRVSKKKVEYQ
jgi:hypothetical protein